jgi:hypothetical protein
MNISHNNQPEMRMCEACGSAMYLFELVQCECGRLVHAGCITDGECKGCVSDNPVGELLDFMSILINQ